ncbi:hypothetical protein Vretifemale_18818, partial [Volvox reticuliferus]
RHPATHLQWSSAPCLRFVAKQITGDVVLATLDTNLPLTHPTTRHPRRYTHTYTHAYTQAYLLSGLCDVAEQKEATEVQNDERGGEGGALKAVETSMCVRPDVQLQQTRNNHHSHHRQHLQ